MTDTNDLLEALLNHAPVVTDGAWGTQLQERGLGHGECPERWNLDRSEDVAAVARAYAEAGSRVVLTNTFGGNRIALASHGLEGRVAEINRRGVELSREGGGSDAAVFASIGPTGKLLIAGDVRADELREIFEEQTGACAAGGADAIVIETMSDIEEARIAVAAAVETGLPVVACMSFSAGKEKDRTMMGVTPEQAVEGLLEAGASIIGANCGNGAAEYEPVCRRLHAASGRPVWLKPNAGIPSLLDGVAVYSTRPEDFAVEAMKLCEAGAGFIGGCCGTGPAFVAALKAALQEQRS